jgi:hypothetical protein
LYWRILLGLYGRHIRSGVCVFLSCMKMNIRARVIPITQSSWWLNSLELCYPSCIVILQNIENTCDHVCRTNESRSRQAKRLDKDHDKLGSSLENIEPDFSNFDYWCINMLTCVLSNSISIKIMAKISP